MSPDQRLASAEPSRAALADAGDPVVVPWRQLERRRASRPPGADRPARRVDDAVDRSVAQFADYRSGVRAAQRAAAIDAAVAEDDQVAAALRLGLHADELDTVLCQHIEGQLDMIARYAPELEQSVDTVMRSLELLLKLRRD